MERTGIEPAWSAREDFRAGSSEPAEGSARPIMTVLDPCRLCRGARVGPDWVAVRDPCTHDPIVLL